MFKWLKKIKRLVAPEIPSTKKNESTLAPLEDSSTKNIPLKPKEEKTCLVCGKTFSTAYGWQRYCSRECGRESKALRDKLNYAAHPKRNPQAEKTCPVCGKTFSTAHPLKTFCSEECRLESHRSPHKEKVCAVCGKTFTAKTENQKTCSTECSSKLANVRRRKSWRRHYKPRGAIVRCETCGKEFQRKNGAAKNCPECRAKLKAEGGKPKEEKACPACQKKFLPTRKSQMYCSTRCATKEYKKKWYIEKKRSIIAPAPLAKVKPQEIKPRTCIFCGKTFTPSKGWARICSPECVRKYQESKLVEKTCPYCKKVFKAKKSTQKFCSRACQYKGHTYISPGNLLPRACEVCGEVFTPKTPAQKICSDECRDKKRGRAQKRDVDCFLCGKEFTTTKGYQKFCSTACKKKSEYLHSKARKLDARKKSSECLTTSPPEERKCVICGKDFIAPSDSDKDCCCTYCELVKDWRHLHPPEERLKKPEKKKTLTDWQKEAHQCGMSYGIYRAQIERFGKTFEELVIK